MTGNRGHADDDYDRTGHGILDVPGAHDLLASLDSTIGVVPQARVVDDGIITSAGVAAGIDMSLFVVESIHGKSVADETAKYMEFRATRRLGRIGEVLKMGAV